MRVQSGGLDHRDKMDYQELPEVHHKLVLLDPQDGQVFQAIRVHLEHRALLDIQVINHITALPMKVLR